MPLASVYRTGRQLKKAKRLVRECRQLWTSKDVKDSTILVPAIDGHGPPVDNLRMRIIRFLLKLGPDFADITSEMKLIQFIQKGYEPELDGEGIPTGREELVEKVNLSGVRRATKLLIITAKLLQTKSVVSGDADNQPPNATLSKSKQTSVQPQASLPSAVRRSRSGPLPSEHHCQIKQITEQLGDWRRQLPEMCSRLDDLHIPISKTKKEQLKSASNRKPDWTDALEENEEAVIQTIKYSIRYCKKNGSAT